MLLKREQQFVRSPKKTSRVFWAQKAKLSLVLTTIRKKVTILFLKIINYFSEVL